MQKQLQGVEMIKPAVLALNLLNFLSKLLTFQRVNSNNTPSNLCLKIGRPPI